jgi:hypothetical protein
MSKPLKSRFFGESGSESDSEPPPNPKAPPKLTPQQKKKLERQRRFDDEQEAQKEAQAAEAKEREEANKRRRERKAKAQQPAAGGSTERRCDPDTFTALATLGLTPAENNLPAINRAYRALALKHHPDKGGDPEVCKRINAAHDYLTDEA